MGIPVRATVVSMLLAFAAATAAAASACGPNRPERPQEEDEMAQEMAPEMARPTIAEVQEAHTEEWMALPGVVGTGIGLCDEEPCIRVFLSRPSPEAEEAIPSRLEGYPVDLEVTGEVRPR